MVVDVQAVQNPYHPERGIARYVREQSRALLEGHDTAIECFVANPKLGLVDGLEPLVASGSLRWNRASGPDGRDLDSKPFLYYATSVFELGMDLDDAWPRYVRRPGVLLAVTVYDLIPLIYAHHYLRDRSAKVRYRTRLGLIQQADLVLAISEATAEDVVRLLDIPPARVVTIGTGVSDMWRPPPGNQDPRSVQRAFPDIRPGYVFYTGGIDYRKNMEMLLDAYASLDYRLRRAHQLVITCSMDPAGELALRELIRTLDIEDHVVLTGYVSDESLLSLYQAARLFVFPSLYEGFGLPLVEAIKSGAPSLAADRASMREILPDPQFRFDPSDESAIASAMRKALTDEEYLLRAKEVGISAVRRFTWENVAARTVEACTDVWVRNGPSSAKGEMIGHRTAPVRLGRPRIAWFSPMPPLPSGVADYSARLIRELVDHVDVDVFVEGNLDEFGPSDDERLSLRRHTSFGMLDAAGAFDQVVYCMGNSEFHGYVYEALMRRPGVVLAHEVRFNGFYSWYGRNRAADTGFFHRSLIAQHPTVPLLLGAGGGITLDEAERFGVYMVTELVSHATNFLVHSRFAANIARLQSEGPPDRIVVIPFGIPDPVERIHAVDSSNALVVTIGIAAPVKRTDTFVEAIPSVVDAIPNARFAIVGYIPSDYEEEIEDLASSLGVSERLTITGHVEPQEYETWLREATCAVQLRSTSNGETSAAIADCLRHGIPTVVTDIGPAREYPPGVVRPIPGGAGPSQVAQAISELLADRAAANSQASAGIEFVRSSSFSQAARSLLDAIGLSGRITPAKAG
jgi:glycosyltransferase involved in cell wall biosynthesis